jgi:hypothetical protein
MTRQTPGRHQPDDEYTPDKQCPDEQPHADHYWRTGSGETTNVVDYDDSVYCYGVKASQS